MHKLIIIAAILFNVSVNAQMTGTYKVTKVSITTGVEQVVFYSNGSADIIHGELRPKVDGVVKTQERVTRETRGTYILRPTADLISHLSSTSGGDEMLPKMKLFQSQGYDTFIGLTYSNSMGMEQYLFCVLKKNELIDVKKGEIYRKSLWPF